MESLVAKMTSLWTVYKDLSSNDIWFNIQYWRQNVKDFNDLIGKAGNPGSDVVQLYSPTNLYMFKSG